MVTEETFAHHALPAAKTLCRPLEILTGRETELNLNVMEKLKSVAAEGLKAVTGYLYEVIDVAFMNPRCCPRATTFQTVPS